MLLYVVVLNLNHIPRPQYLFLQQQNLYKKLLLFSFTYYIPKTIYGPGNYDVYLSFETFSQIGYERSVYLDADMLCVGDFSDIIENSFFIAKKRILVRSIMTALIIFVVFVGIVTVLWVGARDGKGKGRLNRALQHLIITSSSPPPPHLIITSLGAA